MAAAQGHARAQFNIGWYYLFGEGGFSCDQTKASEWLAKAAEQGHVSAKYILAHNYLRGRGVGQDHVRAFELFKEASDQGLEHAKYDLSLSYVFGRGVEKSVGSFFRGVELLQELVLAGYSDEFPQDMYNFAVAVKNTADMKFGMLMGAEVAAKETPKGAAFLEEMTRPYIDRGGLTRWCEQQWNNAFRILQLAAKHGLPEAMAGLASCFAHGVIVERDDRKAMEWASKAKAHGCTRTSPEWQTTTDILKTTRFAYSFAYNGWSPANPPSP